MRCVKILAHTVDKAVRGCAQSVAAAGQLADGLDEPGAVGVDLPVAALARQALESAVVVVLLSDDGKPLSWRLEEWAARAVADGRQQRLAAEVDVRPRAKAQRMAAEDGTLAIVVSSLRRAGIHPRGATDTTAACRDMLGPEWLWAWRVLNGWTHQTSSARARVDGVPSYERDWVLDVGAAPHSNQVVWSVETAVQVVALHTSVLAVRACRQAALRWSGGAPPQRYLEQLDEQWVSGLVAKVQDTALTMSGAVDVAVGPSMRL